MAHNQIEQRVVIIRRSTRLDDLIYRFNTVGQARFYIEHLGESFADYENEHRTYHESLKKVITGISRLAKIQVVDRGFLPNFIFAPNDIVVVVGQDGLVANCLKYLAGQPVIGINPDPDRWDGVLLPYHPREAEGIVEVVGLGEHKIQEVTLGIVELTNGQKLLAVNDFFIGQKTHRSARYRVRFGGAEEAQSSSGIIVSTGLGSSGWLKSVLAGARGISRLAAGQPGEITQKAPAKAAGKNSDGKKVGHQRDHWGQEHLVFSVREPFPSNTTGTELVYGRIDQENPFSVVSQMGENGVIFSDGMENDFLEFNSGMEARIGLAGRKGKVVL